MILARCVFHIIRGHKNLVQYTLLLSAYKGHKSEFSYFQSVLHGCCHSCAIKNKFCMSQILNKEMGTRNCQNIKQERIRPLVRSLYDNNLFFPLLLKFSLCQVILYLTINLFEAFSSIPNLFMVFLLHKVQIVFKIIFTSLLTKGKTNQNMLFVENFCE